MRPSKSLSYVFVATHAATVLHTGHTSNSSCNRSGGHHLSLSLIWFLGVNGQTQQTRQPVFWSRRRVVVRTLRLCTPPLRAGQSTGGAGAAQAAGVPNRFSLGSTEGSGRSGSGKPHQKDMVYQQAPSGIR